MKKLRENINIGMSPAIPQDSLYPARASLDDLFMRDLEMWSTVPVPELGVLLVRLKVLSDVHKTHHWISSGDAFYGDHLLFQRLYDEIVDEIDSVAERAVGLGGPANVNINLVAHQVVNCIAQNTVVATIPQPDQLFAESLRREKAFLDVIDHLLNSMTMRGTLTNGIENLVQGIADTHESHVYLLQQRLSKPMSGGSF